MMAALLLGAGEPLAVRVLLRARSLTPAEADALAPAVAVLCQRGVRWAVYRSTYNMVQSPSRPRE
ncbi:MAG: hypothetical protein ACRC35_00905 [Angustibacter sp.]